MASSTTTPMTTTIPVAGLDLTNVKWVTYGSTVFVPTMGLCFGRAPSPRGASLRTASAEW
jgi:hypothetical protein